MKTTYRITKTDFNRQTTFNLKLFFVGNLTCSGALYTQSNTPFASAIIYTESDYIELTFNDNYTPLNLDNIDMLKIIFPSLEKIDPQ